MCRTYDVSGVPSEDMIRNALAALLPLVGQYLDMNRLRWFILR
jgi:hypothetical protein